MDKFKIRGGDFIGLIVPGIYLMMNIVLLFTNNISNISDFFKESHIKEDIGIFFLFLVSSYIIGCALRLLSTDFPDRLSAQLRIYYKKIINILKKIFLNKNKNDIKNSSLKGLKEKFPYFEWYLDTCLTGLSNSAKKFFLSIYNEFKLSQKTKFKINYKFFFNNCKIDVTAHEICNFWSRSLQ
ncbi:MAG: hypothetical protein JXB50_12335 [Spirochaetes bacterium]|nr:hypothetical protein [Spirochaetota bacterium]